VLTVVTSGKAAPGVSTSVWALALSWPRPLLVVDADPAGGDLAAGLLPGRLSVDRGLVSWASMTRRATPAETAATMLAQVAATLPERESVWFLPGFTTSTQGSSFTEESWERLAGALTRVDDIHDHDVLVDTGRIVGERGNWPLLRAADRVLVAARPSVRSVHAAQDVLQRLRLELGDLGKASALVVGDGPYPTNEVTTALGLPIAGHLPADPSTAAVLSDGAIASPRFGRSPLMRSAARVAEHLAAPLSAAQDMSRMEVLQ
jgi:hypothetical protein